MLLSVLLCSPRVFGHLSYCIRRRTEAQQRAALHAHILIWFRPRKHPPLYKALEPVPRSAPGSDIRQRMKDQVVEPLQQRHEDSVYQLHEVARVRAEMVRPNVAGPKWGGLHVRSSPHSRPGPRDPDAASISSQLHAQLLPQRQELSGR